MIDNIDHVQKPCDESELIGYERQVPADELDCAVQHFLLHCRCTAGCDDSMHVDNLRLS